MTTLVLPIVGDEDTACLDTNRMLKATLPNPGLWNARLTPAKPSIWKSRRYSAPISKPSSGQSNAESGVGPIRHLGSGAGASGGLARAFAAPNLQPALRSNLVFLVGASCNDP